LGLILMRLSGPLDLMLMCPSVPLGRLILLDLLDLSGLSILSVPLHRRRLLRLLVQQCCWQRQSVPLCPSGLVSRAGPYFQQFLVHLSDPLRLLILMRPSDLSVPSD
jgi:hypothetical protein